MAADVLNGTANTLAKGFSKGGPQPTGLLGALQPGMTPPAPMPAGQAPLQAPPIAVKEMPSQSDLISLANQRLKDMGRVPYDQLPKDQQDKLINTMQNLWIDRQKRDK